MTCKWCLPGLNGEGGNRAGNSCYILICSDQKSQTRVMFSQDRQTADKHIRRGFLIGRKDLVIRGNMTLIIVHEVG